MADAVPAWIALDALPGVGETFAFTPDDAHYLKRVCRVRPGESLTATDGRGGVAEIEVRLAGNELVGYVAHREARERSATAVVWCGAPEGERADWMVEKLAELGVATLQPLELERGGWESGARKLDRWRRLARAALRQSRQAWALEVRPPVGLGAALESARAAGARWLADPAGRPAGSFASPGSDATAAIGPAAGFTESEWSTLRAAGFEPISLSRSRLRTETAALAWAAWWAAGSA